MQTIVAAISCALLILLQAAPSLSKLRGSVKLSDSVPITLQSESYALKVASRYQEMLEYSKREPLINFVTAYEFKEYIIRQPRNYSVLVFFSADTEYCTACAKIHNFLVDFAVKIAESHYKDGKSQLMFFVEMKRSDAPKVFSWLQIHRVPEVMLVGENGKLSNVTLFDHHRFNVNNPEHVEQWLKLKLQVKGIDVHRSPEDGWPFWINVLAIIVMLLSALVCRDLLKSLFTNLTYLANFSIFVFVMLTAGHIFNHIRSPPLIGTQPEGGLIFFLARYNDQFEVESFIISFIYTITALGCLGLIEGRRLVLEQEEAGLEVSTLSLLATCGGYVCIKTCASLKTA